MIPGWDERVQAQLWVAHIYIFTTWGIWKLKLQLIMFKTKIVCTLNGRPLWLKIKAPNTNHEGPVNVTASFLLYHTCDISYFAKENIVFCALLGFDPTCRICHVLRFNKVRHLNLHYGLDIVVGDDRLDLLPPRQHVLPRDRDSTKTFFNFFRFFGIGNWGIRHYFVICDWGKEGLVFKVICVRRFLPENVMPLKKKNITWTLGLELHRQKC